jgi:thioredoxin-related protein
MKKQHYLLRRRLMPPALIDTLLAVGFSLIGIVGFAGAQEVTWRSDYNAARREAQEKSLPLILDFGTENCFWCKKLDESTFRDSAILGLLTEHFVPLKVDANRNAFLTEALRVQSFPTIVLAAPDGKILGTFEGYMEAPRMQELLQNVVASLSSPEWMTRDCQDAAKAVAASDYPRAITLLKGILEDGKNTPAQVKARQIMSEVEQQAALRLAKAKQTEASGHLMEATEILGDLIKNFSGTQSASDAGQLLSALDARPEVKAEQRARRAREILAQVREDYRSKQFLCCLDRCELLVASFGDLPEGVEAAQLLAEIKNNPEWMREACETLGDRLGFLYLAQAESWVKKGQLQQAVICLERVLQAYPATRQAEAAKTRLAQLQGQPIAPSEFKTPVTANAVETKKVPPPAKPGS